MAKQDKRRYTFVLSEDDPLIYEFFEKQKQKSRSFQKIIHDVIDNAGMTDYLDAQLMGKRKGEKK